MNTEAALVLIQRERMRQEELLKQGKFSWTCAAPVFHTAKLAVLAEEFGEVCKEVCEQMILEEKEGITDIEIYYERLRNELIQVAAVCVAWLESLGDEKIDKDDLSAWYLHECKKSNE